MKYRILFLTSLYSLTFLNAYNHNNIVVSALCELINERTYFLQRLESLMIALKTSCELFEFPMIKNPEVFSHSMIQEMLLEIETSRSLTPFFETWKVITQYQKIDDKLLIHEFTKVALFLIKRLSTVLDTKKNTREPLNQYDFVFDNTHISYTELLTLRFYYAQRLQVAIKLLTTIRCHKESFFEFTPSEKGCNCIFSSKVHFKHKEIIACITKMEKNNSLDPLIALAHEFSSYKLIHNDQFTKEFILLILCVYKNLLVNNARHRNPTFEKVMSTYDTIESLPLEQVLATIDILMNELPMLLEHYHFNSYSSWRRWLKKYWWVPPIIGITITTRIALTFKQNSNNFGSFRGLGKQNSDSLRWLGANSGYQKYNYT